MFSPVKAIVAGALVFALGGLFLVAKPLDQQGNAPGAATDAVDPGPAAYVQGFMTEDPAPDIDTEVQTYDDAGNRTTLRGMVVLGTVEMDDPRISGDWEETVRIDEFPQPDTDVRVEIHWGELTITNDQGAWSGSWKGTYDGSRLPDELELGLYELTGTGAYEGLSALLSVSEPQVWGGDYDWAFAGAIFPGPLPPDSAYGE